MRVLGKNMAYLMEVMKNAEGRLKNLRWRERN
jgi:hypothetical protein